MHATTSDYGEVREAGCDKARPNRMAHLPFSPPVTVPPTRWALIHPSILLNLQRTVGNHTTASLFTSRTPVQRRGCCASCATDGQCQEAEGSEAEERRPATILPAQRTVGDGHDLTSPRFAGDVRLEACYDDQARLGRGATGESVTKIQQALIEWGYDLGSAGADGIYGERTSNAVKAFKKNEQLGWEHMGDVGPGTIGRLNQLYPSDKDDIEPVPPVTPDDPGVVGKPLVCAGSETEIEGGAVGDSILDRAPDDPTGKVQRRGPSAPPPVARTPYCPVPQDYSSFGEAPANSDAAAHVLLIFLPYDDVIKTLLALNRSWVNRDMVPEGVGVPKKILWIERYVSECHLHFSKQTGPFIRKPPTCEAVDAKPQTAGDRSECSKAFRANFYNDLARDGRTRLLRHEQYHVKLGCALAEIANERVALSVAQGVDKKTAIQNEIDRLRLRNKALQENHYDSETKNGCNSSSQAAWEVVIDTPGALKLAYGP